MDYFRLLLGFKGRLNRARYLMVQLALLTFWLVWLRFQPQFSSQWTALGFGWAVAITMIWINTATTARRLHDRNRSGWWAVAVYIVNHLSYLHYGLFFGLYFGVDIPTAGQLLLVMFAVALSLLQTGIVIELFFMMGTDGSNRFGPDPARAAPGSPVVSRARPDSVPDFLMRRAGPTPR